MKYEIKHNGLVISEPDNRDLAIEEFDSLAGALLPCESIILMMHWNDELNGSPRFASIKKANTFDL